MRFVVCVLFLTMIAAPGCSRNQPKAVTLAEVAAADGQVDSVRIDRADSTRPFIGLDRNEYPGDEAMAALKKQFAFTGYWLTVPPGASVNQWTGKRKLLRDGGWGFLVLANGKLEAEIKKAQHAGTSPANLGKADALNAIASARREGFPKKTILFVDQEEGSRLTEMQAAYLLAWTEAVAASEYLPGVYASGQLVQDSPGVTIDTVQDIRMRVKQAGLHPVAIFDYQDGCPPAPGCTVQARPMREAGEPDIIAWQYAQSPRRAAITKSCAATYAKDGNCYPPAPLPHIFIDMDVAATGDPSNGR